MKKVLFSVVSSLIRRRSGNGCRMVFDEGKLARPLGKGTPTEKSPEWVGTKGKFGYGT